MRITNMLALLLAFLTATNVFAQEPVNPEEANAQPVKKELLPYQKYPELPAFNILMADSTVFNTYMIPKGRPTVLMLFGTECDHCQHFTEAMSKAIDSLKNVDIYMVTFGSLDAVRVFKDKYACKCSNIHIGLDYENFFPRFYGAEYVPFIVLYDKKKRFNGVFEGNTIDQLYRALRYKP